MKLIYIFALIAIICISNIYNRKIKNHKDENDDKKELELKKNKKTKANKDKEKINKDHTNKAKPNKPKEHKPENKTENKNENKAEKKPKVKQDNKPKVKHENEPEKKPKVKAEHKPKVKAEKKPKIKAEKPKRKDDNPKEHKKPKENKHDTKQDKPQQNNKPNDKPNDLKAKQDKKHKPKKNKPHRDKNNKSLGYQFAIGLVKGIAGNVSYITTCSKEMEAMEKVGTEEKTKHDKNDKDTLDSHLSGEITSFHRTREYLGTGINICCRSKKDLITFLSTKRRFKRLLFIQTNTKFNIKEQTIKKDIMLFNDLKGYFKKNKAKLDTFVKSIENTKSQGKDFSLYIEGVDWSKKKGNELKAKVKEVINDNMKPIVDNLEEVKESLTKWMPKNTFLKETKPLLECIKKAHKDNLKVTKSLSGLNTIVPKMNTPEGWFKLVINLICGWEDLEIGVEYLLSINAKTTLEQKYNFYGKFIGRFLSAVGGDESA